MRTIVAERLNKVELGRSEARFRLICTVNGTEAAFDMPVLDLLPLLPQLNSISATRGGDTPRGAYALADHGLMLGAQGEVILSLRTDSGLTLAFELSAEQSDQLRSTLANVAAMQKPGSVN